MDRDVIQAEMYALLREQNTINVNLLHSITLIAQKTDLLKPDHDKVLSLLREAIQLMRGHDESLGKIKEALIKLHNFTGEELRDNG